MAGKPIEISLVANTGDFIRGTKDAAGALEDVGDSLDDLVRDADNAGDKLGDSLKDGAKEAEEGLDDLKRAGKDAGEGVEDGVKDAIRSMDRLEKAGEDAGEGVEAGAKEGEAAVEKLERSFKDMANTFKREDLGKTIGKDVKRGTDEASEGMDNLKDESKETAREAAASFDGSAESIIDAFQEVAANAFIGFGPAGLAAGLAIAAGLGIAISAGQGVADAVNDAKSRMVELATALDEAGGDMAKVDIAGMVKEWGLAIADTKEWYEVWQEDAVTNLEKVQKAAKDVGVGWEDMLLAMSGTDAEAARDMIEQIDKKLEELHDGNEANGEDFWGFESNQLRDYRKQLESNIEIQEGAIQHERDLTGALGEHASAAEAAAAAEELRADAVSAIQGELDAGIGLWEDYYDAETGAVDPAAFIEAMRARREAVADWSTNVQDLIKQGLDPAAAQAILDEGVSMAPVLESIVNSGMAEEFIAEANAGVNGAEQQVANGVWDADGTVTLNANSRPANASIRQVERGRYNATVNAGANTRGAEGSLNRAARTRNSTINARVGYVDTSAIDQSLAGVRTVNVRLNQINSGRMQIV
jgi:hypothetical protein